MLANLVDRDLAPAIGKAIVSLLVVRRKELLDDGKGEKVWLGIWSDPVREALRSEELRQRVVTYVLPGLLKPSCQGFQVFCESLGLSADGGVGKIGDADLGALLCVLKAGKELGFVGELGDSETTGKASKAPAVPLSSELVAPLLGHAFPHIRVSALNLVIQSAAITRPLSRGALFLLKTMLPSLHAETDAEIRDQTISAIRNLIERIAQSSYASEKELKNVQQKLRSGNRPTPDDIRKMIQLDSRIGDAKEFCGWYIGFLETLLRPGSNYQRCIMGLRALGFLARSGMDASLTESAFAALPGNGSIISRGEPFKKNFFKWPEFSKEMRVFSPGVKKVLLEAMSNPFEDVRAMSSEIVRLDPQWDKEEITGILDRGLKAMNETGRARDSDGVARSVALLYEVVKRGDLTFNEGDRIWGTKISVADSETMGLGVIQWVLDVIEQEYLGVAASDLARAVKERPVHGLFEAVGRILGSNDKVYLAEGSEGATAEWTKIHERIFKACEEIWRITKAPLCFDSPEGHVPSEIDEEDEDMNTQTVMSYSWRAIKESSALLGIVLAKAPAESLNQTDFGRGGKLLLQQLSDIRHRGAFSAVSPSFVALCTRCFKSPDPALQELPRAWLRRNLESVMEKSSAITRRSAGLPFLIVGVLASEIDPNHPLLSSTFARLDEIAVLPPVPSKNGEKIDLPQVHALNCIKFLFTDARMSPLVVPYIGRGLELAVSCFGSEIWAIRNCGVMLFTALTNRLFGLRKSRNEFTSNFTTRSFFEKYPTVRVVLLENLRDKVGRLEGGEAASVEMVYPALSLLARMEVAPEYEGMEEFRPLILECMRSRIWKVREMAARAFTALVGPKQAVDVIRNLLSVGPEKQNILHGNLCAVRALLERRVRQAVLEEQEAGEVYGNISLTFQARFQDLVERNQCSVTRYVILQILTANATPLLVSEGLAECVHGFISSLRSVTEECNTSSMVGRSLLKEQLVAFILTCAPPAKFSNVFLSLLGEPDEEVVLYSLTHLLSLPTIPNLDASIQTSLWTLATTHPWPLLVSNTLNVLHRLSKTLPFTATPENIRHLESVLNNPPTEPIKETALALLGPLTTSTSTLTTLLPHLRAAAHEDSPFTLRHAALTSFSALAPLLKLTRSAPNAEELIPAYALLFDYLNDDDDELRILAAELTQLILPGDGEILHLPLVAAEKLALELPRCYPGSKALLQEAITRITGGMDARETWKRVATRDTILFRREKQNLWVHAPWAVSIWAAVAEMVAARLDGAEMEMELAGLKAWVEAAGECVAEMERREGSRATVGGWASDEGVEVFCTRVEAGRRLCGL
ncbi:putative death-receptor fusion protein-domain-containing protein [Sphaerosporella brunnea]|uniref:Putative death-receptor fusion protein-domain-containing protein n=1 Tax=Sphaerosporella brunnea TaxID=1250544 RepID=A0A5J5F572_9PEZI|nr:putative death-receptor fusion protein-domain-containing protein [Sphaerosporella brunnea]